MHNASNCQDTPNRKHVIGITVGAPWVNNYSYYDYDLKELKSKSGFFGLAGSLYLRTKRNKLSMNIGVTADLPAPVGPIDYLPEGTRSNIGSVYLEFVDHANVYKSVNFIAGLNFVRYIYKLTSYEDSLPGYRKYDNTVGVTMGAEYKFNRRWSVAAYYRPAVYSFDIKQYRHFISLAVTIDIDL